MSQTLLKSYALLGSGRVARHLHFYLKSLDLPVLLWSRDGREEFNSFSDEDAASRLAQTVGASSHILFAVSDRALGEVTTPWLASQKTLVHFSGAARISGVHAAHPLMTFSERLEEAEWYRRIPFVIDQGDNFQNILPGLPNQSFELAPEKRPLYHALASLAGNSCFLLWRNIGDAFESKMGLPRHLLIPFLHQVVENAGHQSVAGGFTGPVARGDWQTVQSHIQALAESDLASAYRDFLNLARKSGHPIPQEML